MLPAFDQDELCIVSMMHGHTNIKSDTTSYPLHLDARNITAVFAGFQASPTRLSDKNSIQVNTSMKQW